MLCAVLFCLMIFFFYSFLLALELCGRHELCLEVKREVENQKDYQQMGWK